MTIYIVTLRGEYDDLCTLCDEEILDIFKDEDSAKRLVKEILREHESDDNIDVKPDKMYRLIIPDGLDDRSWVYYHAYEVH